MSTATSTTIHEQKQYAISRSRKTGIASSPSLHTLYSAHSRLAPGAGALPRKTSFAALTPGSLATIPDDTESYAIHSVLSETPSPPRKMAATPSKRPGGDVAVGDEVDVPGNMSGVIRFIGSVNGKKGTFAGVELHADYASRGKNNGEVDGVSYFTTETPGAGIFVPVSKLSKRDDTIASAASLFPPTPSGSGHSALKLASQNTTNHTPPTPLVPKLAQSLGPSRAQSPALRRPRTSLPRPDSPVRKLQLPPPSRSGMTTPSGQRDVPPRYGSPSIKKFGSSMYGTNGETPRSVSRLNRKLSLAPRSVSALGQVNSRSSEDEATPVAKRPQTNGSVSSMSSSRMRAPSRAAGNNDEEVERLKKELEGRDQQLKEQAAALNEMEKSVAELTTLMDNNPDIGRRRDNSLDDKDTMQLRTMLREKNEKIAMLTAEFDAHRADFRSTIDTLEMASTETQRVYDARIHELEQEIQDMHDRTDDVDSVAKQLKQLEELVQELEEGLEDARRGEAEARGEVEFLRGEVERTRTELRREREKASASTNGEQNGVDSVSLSKELEKKEDEIRGLKAIIHSLSRDSIPGNDGPDQTSAQPQRTSSLEARLAKEKLEREVVALKDTVANKAKREEELEREVESLRRRSAATHRGSVLTIGSRSSYRDSRGTIVPPREPRSPEHKRKGTLDTMPESDAHSSVTESSALWCEICETGGHDILTCTNVFGPQADQNKTNPSPVEEGKGSLQDEFSSLKVPGADEQYVPRPLTPAKSPQPSMQPQAEPQPQSQPPQQSRSQPQPQAQAQAPPPPPSNVQLLPDPGDTGPLAGKESGVIDPEKWCALCERDGHDSIDCPLEDAF